MTSIIQSFFKKVSSLKKSFFYFSIFFISLGIFNFSNNVFATGNIYEDADLTDINLSTLNFNGYPIKVNIKSYYNANQNKYIDGTLDKAAIMNKNFVEFIFEDGEKVVVPVNRLLFSTKLGGKYNIDSDLIIDMPLYLKNKIDYGYVVKANIKLLKDVGYDTNNAFILETGIPYIENGKTIWLIYNTNNVTSEDQFLPRKVLVKLYDGNTLLRTQVIDVFKEGKLSVQLDGNQTVTKVEKENFYVIGNTNEKNYWYANGPVIDSITCPNKITTATTCVVNIVAFDSGKVKLYIKDKYNKTKYQFWSWDVQATGGKIKKSFLIDPALGYPDGEYKIIGVTYKNGIQQQLYDKNEFVIDRFKPSFAEVFPTLYVPDNATGSATVDVTVSERLKADPIGLKCDLPVTNVKRDNTNPFLYHITVNIPSTKDLRYIKCNLEDIGLNTNEQYLYLKRYKDNGNMGITNINSITNGLNMNVSVVNDKFILTKVNSLGDGTTTICSNGNCSDKIVGIETYQNDQLSKNKEILISGGDNGTTIYKTYPDTKIYSSGYKTQITSITSDYLGNYWVTDKDGNFYKNNVLIGNKQNLEYYNIYKGSYIIEYYKDDGLYIDTKKIDNNIVSGNYLGIDIIKPIDADNVYMVGLDTNHRLHYLKINLLQKKVTDVLTVNVNGYSNNNYPDYVDFAYYLNKLIILGGNTNDSRGYISIMPIPEIVIENLETNNKISYVAHNNLMFGKELYEDLGLKALVKGYMLPEVDDCAANKTITIGGSDYKFDDNEWCNIKELNLDKTEETKSIEPKMYYQQTLDDYVFNRKFNLYVKKFGIEKDLGKKELKLQNQPKEYRIGFVKASDILTKENSPGWSYIKYNDKTFLSLPEIIHYSIHDDIKNDGFYIYKKNLKLQSLENKTGLYYPVVVYKTNYNTSEVRVLGISTTTDYITDPETGEYKAVKRVVFNKPYKIDTVAPIYFDIKSDNTNPSVGDKIKISFKTTEPVNIKYIKIGDINVYDSTKIIQTNHNNIYYYELPDVKITTEMFTDQGQLWLSVAGDDLANNYNERKVNIAGLKGGLSVSSLQVGKIENAGEINIKDLLVSNDQNVENMNNIDVLTDKKIITDKKIGTTLHRTSDGQINLEKLFKGKKMLNIINMFTNNNSILQQYFITPDSGTNICQYNYIDSNNEFRLGGNCGFIRNRVYNINSDLRINQPLKYEGYSTLFVNGDVYINGNILSKKDEKQNILGIIATGNVYISHNVTHVQAIIKTEKNIYVNK